MVSSRSILAESPGSAMASLARRILRRIPEQPSSVSLGGRRRGRLLLPALLFQVRVRLAAAEEIPQLHVQIRLIPEVAFIDHLLQVLLHPVPGIAQGAAQLFHCHSLVIPNHGQILVVPLQTAADGDPAAEHSPTGSSNG